MDHTILPPTRRRNGVKFCDYHDHVFVLSCGHTIVRRAPAGARWSRLDCNVEGCTGQTRTETKLETETETSAMNDEMKKDEQSSVKETFFSYDPENDILTIYGTKFTGELFRTWQTPDESALYRFTRTWRNEVTVEKVEQVRPPSSELLTDPTRLDPHTIGPAIGPKPESESESEFFITDMVSGATFKVRRQKGMFVTSPALEPTSIVSVDKVETNRADRTDVETVNWLEDNLDDLTVIRDKSAGKRVELTFCSSVSGCPVDIDAATVRDAVRRARAQEALAEVVEEEDKPDESEEPDNPDEV